jgi:hypothetical protein
MASFLDVKEEVASVYEVKDHEEGARGLEGVVQLEDERMVKFKKDLALEEGAACELLVLYPVFLDCLHSICLLLRHVPSSPHMFHLIHFCIRTIANQVTNSPVFVIKLLTPVLKIGFRITLIMLITFH